MQNLPPSPAGGLAAAHGAVPLQTFEGSVGRAQRITALAAAGTMALAVMLFTMTDRQNALGRLRTAGVVRIGYADEAPFAMLGKNGDVTGEAPEIARHVADSLGIGRIEWHRADFAALIPDLLAGRIDVIASGLFVTPERERRVLFSKPTMAVRQAALVSAGNPAGIGSYRDIARRGDLRVAVLADSVEDAAMTGFGLAGDRLLRVPDALTGRRAVETGLADALLLSEPSLRWMLSCCEPGRFEVVVDGAGEAGLAAFAFRPDEPELREAWDAVLAEYLGSAGHLDMLSTLGLGWSPSDVGGGRP